MPKKNPDCKLAGIYSYDIRINPEYRRALDWESGGISRKKKSPGNSPNNSVDGSRMNKDDQLKTEQMNDVDSSNKLNQSKW